MGGDINGFGGFKGMRRNEGDKKRDWGWWNIKGLGDIKGWGGGCKEIGWRDINGFGGI